jgi:hypothetical protein
MVSLETLAGVEDEPGWLGGYGPITAQHTFTTCNRPARIGDLDHIVPFPDGPTAAHNLHPPCERHHIGKHQAGWTVRRNPDGSTTWTSPQGRTYTTRPPERWTTPNAA